MTGYLTKSEHAILKEVMASLYNNADKLEKVAVSVSDRKDGEWLFMIAKIAKTSEKFRDLANEVKFL